MNRKHYSYGFTMIELAISLVIIGIIMFSILKGSPLILTAKEKKTVETMDSLNSALRLYETRHPNQFPTNTKTFNGYTSVLNKLAAEGFIKKSYDTATGSINSPLGPVKVDVLNSSLSKVYINLFTVTPDSAKIIDENKDDGRPLTGDCIIGTTAGSGPTGTLTWTAATTPTSNDYKDVTSATVEIRCGY